LSPSAPETENAWIEDFRLPDGIADVETPTALVATVRYEGARPRAGVQVTLAIGGVEVAAQTVALQPGQARQVRFEGCRFDAPAEPGRPSFVTAQVSIPNDRLPGDDQRLLVVPVVAALPVVFVDQYGREEDPQRNRFGETYRLRRLLAPRTTRGPSSRGLIQVRHVRIDQLDRQLLADARLVIIAGVGSPGAAVPLLRQYVEQGGSLVICAGGEFDAKAWTDAAWNDGLGVLPAPLKPEPVGQLPTRWTGQLSPFQLDPASMVHEDFVLEARLGTSWTPSIGCPTSSWPSRPT